MGVQSAAPELVLKTDGDSQLLSPSRDYHLGRDPLSDIVLADPRVSWHHAVLHPDGGHWTLDDVGSTNGTYCAGSTLRFGDALDGAWATLSDLPRTPAAPANPTALTALTGSYRQPTRIRRLPTRTVRIGRSADNDLVVPDLTVSRNHAELRAGGDGTYEIVDLGSHNGTYLNGGPVDRAPLGPTDLLSIGHSVFCLVGDELQEFVDTGEVTLDVADLVVEVGGGQKTLLDQVSFPVGQKSMLAVAGPSGAGKSTLLNALTGLRPADRGTVHYDGRDLYRDYAELRRRIGLVPQDDILHTQLTVRRALGYAAELGLEQRADQVISSLSGGQRKRVSVALELLTKPSLLFLDEPTSGLDPGMDRSVMHMLRDLADDGRTVVVVTHSVLSLDVCDRLLLLAPGGRIAFYGPPDETLSFFGFADWPDAFEAFETDRDRDWAGQFRGSGPYREYIASVLEKPGRSSPQPHARVDPAPAQGWGSQVGTLIRRYSAALAADRTFLAIMVALPFVMGAMARALAGSALTSTTALNALLIVCVGCVLTGAANAVRELVKERVIYQRERAVGLSRSAYLCSKLVVLGSVTVVQSVVLTMVGLFGVKLRPSGGGVLMPPLLEIALAAALLGFTAMTLGLLVSALVKKEEVTMPLLVLLAIVQVVFCGALLPLNGVPVLDQLSWLVPSRWALGAMASTIDLHSIVPGSLTADPLFVHTTARWVLDMGMMVVLSALYSLLVARLLRRHEPAVMRK
jgi:ABC-type multidrug transport system ATPase subunit/ABC-type multidrug transport system permease subunit